MSKKSDAFTLETGMAYERWRQEFAVPLEQEYAGLELQMLNLGGQEELHSQLEEKLREVNAEYCKLMEANLPKFFPIGGTVNAFLGLLIPAQVEGVHFVSLANGGKSTDISFKIGLDMIPFQAMVKARDLTLKDVKK